MSINDRQESIDFQRERLDLYEVSLRGRVRDSCPGDHETRQHRDRQPPWCPWCGRTDRGERIKNVDQ